MLRILGAVYKCITNLCHYLPMCILHAHEIIIIIKLDNACARRTSKHIIRVKFFQLKQEGKSINHFVMEMRKQVNDCQFGYCILAIRSPKRV